MRVTVNRNDLNATPLTTKLQTKNLSISDLAIERMRVLYPIYKNIDVTSIQRVDEFYVVNFGATISISFKFNNFNFVINRPL